MASLAAATSNAGAFGVDLFFLLSSYLITSLLLRERQATGRIDLRSFYARRILRIWPLYFFALAITPVWSHFQPTTTMPMKYLVAYLLLAGNWMTVIYGAPPSFMSILWSVSVEEQFYLCWPVIFKATSKNAMCWVGGVLVASAWGTRIYLAGGALHAYTVWPDTFARLDAIGLGILLAAKFGPELPDWKIPERAGLLAVGLIVWLVAGHYSGPTPMYTVLGYPVMTAGSVMIFLSFAGARISSRTLVYLGKISYGLYVYHMLCLTIARLLFGGRMGHLVWFVAAISLALAITIALAALSYKFLESPFLNWKKRFTYINSRPV
jgi:peptidoglycan/LPS O-acetylase OafA/YrhL